MNEADFKILFVCMGNICRSPTAEAIFSKKLADPYYGGDQGFEHVLDLIEEASEGLIKFTLQKVTA